MISVILPVFNAEKYLCRCVMSVSAQSLSDWQLIIVDDGSTDNSLQLALDMARNEPRIKVISTVNSGPSAARNSGLKHADGDFIFFIDADDLIHHSTLDTLFKEFKEPETDVVVAQICRFSGNKISTSLLSDTKKSILSGKEATEKTLYQKKMNASACGKLFRKHLFDDLMFEEGIRYEDLLLIPFIFLKSRRVVALDIPLYFYRQHKESYIHTPSLSRSDVLNVTSRITGRLRSLAPDLVAAAQDRELSAAFNMLLLFSSRSMKILSYTNEKDLFRKNIISICKKKIRRLRSQSLLNKKVRLKNKAGILLSYLLPLGN